MAKDNGYVGRISNAGTQVVEAPHQVKAPKGNSVVKSGNDLRCGKASGKK